MGWTDSHLREFDAGGNRYGQPDPDWDAPGEVAPEGRVTFRAPLQAATPTTELPRPVPPS